MGNFIELECSLTKKITLTFSSSYNCRLNRCTDFQLRTRLVWSLNTIHSFQVTILLKDINDRIPVFQFQDYQSEVSEDSSAGTTVTTVQATDKDSPENTVVIHLLTFS